jgi:uncharacterized membrane protein YtjA (UPF0391 family)
MLRFAIACFLIALTAAFVGFAGVAPEYEWLAKVLFFVFVVAAALTFMGHTFRRRSIWD